MSAKKFRFRDFFRFFAIFSRQSFCYFFFATFCVKVLDLSKSTKTKLMNSKKTRIFIFPVFVMDVLHSWMLAFMAFMDVSIAVTLACFIILLKDCVGQAIFAKVLGGITQIRNCVFYQLSITLFRRIEKSQQIACFYQFT